MQETDLKDFVAGAVEAMDPGDSEAAIIQLGGYTDHNEELHGKAVEKDNHSKTSMDG